MSFIEQAAAVFTDIPELHFQVVMFGRNALYLEGAKPIKIAVTEMLFRVGKSVLQVLGEDLSVKELVDDCVSIVGRVDSVAVRDL